MACEKCDQDHLTMYGQQSCPGHILSGPNQGDPCSHELGYGTAHKGIGYCKFHGGATLTHNKSAYAEMLDRESRKVLSIEGFDPITDPYTQLAELAGEVVKLKDVLREKVEELNNLKDVGGEEIATQIDVLVSAYERSLDRAERILMGMARLDLEDRIAKLHTRINTDMANQIMAAMNDTLAVVVSDDGLRELISLGFAARLSGSQQPDSKQAVGAISSG